MRDKRASNLTEFIHNQTKIFREELQNRFLPARLQYFHSIFTKLTQCFEQYITPQAQQELDSTAMLDYYTCYKRTLRSAKDNNRRLYDESLKIEIKMKQCVEIKSTLTKSTSDFEKQREQCFDDFAEKYQELYASVFTPVPIHTIEPEVKVKQEKTSKQ